MEAKWLESFYSNASSCIAKGDINLLRRQIMCYSTLVSINRIIRKTGQISCLIDNRQSRILFIDLAIKLQNITTGKVSFQKYVNFIFTLLSIW